MFQFLLPRARICLGILGFLVLVLGKPWDAEGVEPTIIRGSSPSARPAPATPPAPTPGPAAAAPAARTKPALRILVMPFWNLAGTELDALVGRFAPELSGATSSLAKNPRFALVPQEELDEVMQRDLKPAERESFAAAGKRGDPEAALPFLAAIVKGARANLVIVGTFRKLAGEAKGLGSAEVESWLLAASPSGEIEDPVRHVFKADLTVGTLELPKLVAADEWWTVSEEMDIFAQTGTLHPNAAQLKLRELGSSAKKDKIQTVQAAFPEQFLHAHTCDLTPTQARDVGLATDQLVHLLEPKNPRSHNYRGLVEYCGGNKPQALRFFQEASALDSTFPDPWYNAGTVHWESYRTSGSKEDLDLAFQSYSKALDCESGFAEARTQRGLVWLAKGDPQKADADLEAAYREDQKNPDVLLGRCQVAVAAHRPDQARSFCMSALRADKDLSLAHKILGDLERDRNEVASALREYHEAVRTAPRDSDTRIAIIKMLFDLGKSDRSRYLQARKECEEIIQIEPTHSVPYWYLGKICEEQNDFACAEERYRKAFELGPEWVTLRDDLARVRAKGGRTGSPPPPPTPRRPPSASVPTPAPSAASDTSRPSGGGARHESYEEFLRKYKGTSKAD